MRHPNRNKVRDNVGGGRRFWCPSCDMCLVNDGQRCPVCRCRVNITKRNKRPGPSISGGARHERGGDE